MFIYNIKILKIVYIEYSFTFLDLLNRFVDQMFYRIFSKIGKFCIKLSIVKKDRIIVKTSLGS
jgi:hypothetical protein